MRRSRIAAFAMSAIVGLAATTVLAGWALAHPALTTIGARGVAMNPLTAICFLLLAGALVVLLPAVIVPCALGYLRLAGQRRGLYGTEFGTVLFTLGMMAAFAALVAWTALDVFHIDTQRVETEVRLQTLIRNVPLGIVVLDRDGRVQFCNDAFVELFHYPASELVGRLVDDLIAPERDGGETAALTRRGVAGESLRRSTIRRRRDGTLVPVELYVVPLSMHGRPIGTYGVYRPIADTRQAGSQPRQSGIA